MAYLRQETIQAWPINFIKIMFNYSDKNGVRCFSGDPDCITAYKWTQGLLRKRNPRWLEAGESLNDRQKGNIGEFIAYHVSRKNGYPKSQYICLVTNAQNPLAVSSATGLDLVFIYFDSSDESKDRIFIQEVKTTGNSNLSYATALIADHKKLLEPDIDLNIVSRIQAIKAKLEYEKDISDELLDRLEQMVHSDPAKCLKIVFLPTLIHERKNADPVTALASVRKKISDLGWIKENIKPISLALTDLEDGFERLARNEEF